MTTIEAIDEAIEIANRDYDGHYMLLKFTTNYRFCFGTLMPLDAMHNHMLIDKMAKGKTIEEAISNGIKGNICAFDIMDKIK